MPIRRRSALFGGLAIACAAALARCGPAAADAGNHPAGLLEVTSGWTTDPDRTGMQALLAVLKGRAPDVTFVSGDGSTATDPVARLADGRPPDSIRCSGGTELAELAPHLEPLDSLARSRRWTAGLPAGLQPRLRVGRTLYGVPAGVRRTNLLWSNREVLADAAADPAPADPGLLIAQLQRVTATGRPALAVGGPAEVLHLAETALLAAHGPDAFGALWRPGGPWNSPATTTAQRVLDALLAHAAPITPDADWTDAARLLGTGRAGYLLTGDWADAWLRTDLGLRAGADYRWAAAPGTAGLFQSRADVFTLPRGAHHRTAAVAWLDVCADLDGQVALNGARTAVPARTDLPEPTLAMFGPYARWSLDEWRQRRSLDSLTHGGLLGGHRRAAALAAATAFTTHRDSTRLARELAAA
ncbi:extracellular solute-binding protein [Kitasatospora sp. NPDC059795]|uniref:extracellular solute-binding protein n=1 Tax=Kitasatospora sp. NPDC059795 TaxID=3346949 RepID=UPI00365946C9